MADQRRRSDLIVAYFCGCVIATFGMMLTMDLVGQQAVLDAVVHRWVPSKITSTLSIVVIMLTWLTMARLLERKT